MSHSTNDPSRRPDITRQLAAYAAQSRYSALPDRVRSEAARAFMNWIGCALGGCSQEAVSIAAAVAAETGAAGQASIIGHKIRTDVASAAFVNCISSSILAFDDAHLATVTHPSGPAGSAVFAFSQHRPLSGEDFLHAFALGIELTCRVSNLLVLPPSKMNVGFYVTGLSGPIGVAAAIGNLLGLDEQKMNAAIGIGASQASGFRSTHGTMTAHFRPGHTARCGVIAAQLAAKGFTSDDYALEADNGFFDVYAADANLNLAVEGLGNRFELLANAYKPYPCGIVIHPTLDACLEVRQQLTPEDRIADVTLRVHPLALKLTGVREPATTLESHVSLYHWAAAALLRGSASIPEMEQDCIDNPEVAALRSRMEAIVDPSVGRDQSIVEVTLTDGRRLRAHVETTRGSQARPMTDNELDAKFRSQARQRLSPDKVEQLLLLCRGVASLCDVGREISAILND